MPPADWIMLVSLGGFFLVLGIALVGKGRSEDKDYYDLSSGMDVRGYVEHEPHPGSESLKVGGWIAIAIGLLMLAMEGGFWLWG